MRKALFGLLLLLSLISGLFAQSRLDEFKVLRAEYVMDFKTRDEFVDYVEGFVNYSNGVNPSSYTRIVNKLVPLEQQIINLANQQLPRSTSIGSAWLVHIGERYGPVLYSIYFYSDQNGERYYILIRRLSY
jgi:hypothetical protein